MRVARHPFPLKPRMSVGAMLSVAPAPPPPSSSSASSPARTSSPVPNASPAVGLSAGNGTGNGNGHGNAGNGGGSSHGSGIGHQGSGTPSALRRPPSGGKSWLAAAAAPPRSTTRAGHVLHRTFQFSYVRRTPERRADDYAQQIRDIATVATVEEFWAVYVHLHRVSKLAPCTDYFLFQEGVRPMWEDEANRGGGRLSVRVTKAASPRAFEDLCLALIGEQFDTDDICGIACSVRVTENFLSIWLRHVDDKELLTRVEGVARRALDLPASAVVRDWSFKPHQVEHNNGPS